MEDFLEEDKACAGRNIHLKFRILLKRQIRAEDTESDDVGLESETAKLMCISCESSFSRLKKHIGLRGIGCSFHSSTLKGCATPVGGYTITVSYLGAS